MSWSIGFDEHWKRDIGYGVPCVCDHPDCNEEIDRGLSYVCGGEPYGGDRGCGLFFCYKHLSYYTKEAIQMCAQCGHRRKTFPAKPDSLKWLYFKMTDPSWEGWRRENGLVPEATA